MPLINDQRHISSKISLLTAEKIALTSLMLLQAIYYILYIQTLPIRYDESLSYTHFISRGFVTTASYYPFPNNHVFHNLISGLWLWFPLRIETAIRLSSLFFSLGSTWLLYRLLRSFVKPFTAMFGCVVMASSYPFMLYATQARGYSMIIFFCILLIYSCYSLLFNEQKRSVYLYIFSMVAGMYTIPSFLYPLVVINVCFFLYGSTKRLIRKGSFAIWNIVAAGITLGLYVPLFYVNGFSKVLQPNENETHFSYTQPGLFDQIVGHIKVTLLFISGQDSQLIPWLYFLLCISLLIYYFRSQSKKLQFISLLCIILLLSPPVLILLHRVIPFERTWTYLIVPIALGLGLLTDPVFTWLQARVKSWILFVLTSVTAIVFNAYYLTQFKTKHEAWCFPEYMVSHSTGVLSPYFQKIHSISYSTADWEYYPAEILYYEIYKADKNQALRIQKLPSILNEDLVIINYNDTSAYRLQLAGYNEVDDNPYQAYKVYLRRGIFPESSNK